MTQLLIRLRGNPSGHAVDNGTSVRNADVLLRAQRHDEVFRAEIGVDDVRERHIRAIPV